MTKVCTYHTNANCCPKQRKQHDDEDRSAKVIVNSSASIARLGTTRGRAFSIALLKYCLNSLGTHMPYKKVTSLGLHSTDEERFFFEISCLQERVKNLEHIVHELLRGRMHKGLADAWLESSEFKTFTPSTSALEGRGKQIAALLDSPPVEWPPKEA